MCVCLCEKREERELKQSGKLGIQIKAGELLKRALCFSARIHCVNGENPHGVNGKKFALEMVSNVAQETFPFGRGYQPVECQAVLGRFARFSR